MKFLHIADLHIGRRLSGISLLEDQRHILGKILDIAAECDAVLSSRLHLLILAANAGTPGLGIARGSKLANWLSNFNQSVVGSVYDCDWDKVTERVLAAFRERGDWNAARADAYARLNARLAHARAEFVARLAK